MSTNTNRRRAMYASCTGDEAAAAQAEVDLERAKWEETQLWTEIRFMTVAALALGSSFTLIILGAWKAAELFGWL